VVDTTVDAVLVPWARVRGLDVVAAAGAAEVPAQTVAVARAAFPRGALAMRVRDELGEVLTDEAFVDAFGAPAGRLGRGTYTAPSCVQTRRQVRRTTFGISALIDELIAATC
jgi:hypothetical protein